MAVTHWFDEDDLAQYRALGDPLLPYLTGASLADRWLRESEPKRMIAWTVYGPLLRAPRMRIYDMGAGSSSIVASVALRHEYVGVDLCVHDDPLRQTLVGDWASLGAQDADLIISVDLFPNVDQRLAAFLRTFGKTPLRLVLTTYPDRFYRVRRVDADEVLTVHAWTWPQTQRVLWEWLRIRTTADPPPSLFPNGRQVCLVTT